MKLRSHFAALALLLTIGSITAEPAGHLSVAEQSGRIKGVIIDSHEARIAGASILIETKTFRRELRSDDSGEFTVELPTGVYRMKVTHPVFKTLVINELKVLEGDTPIVKIKLVLKTSVASGGKCPKGSLCV